MYFLSWSCTVCNLFMAYSFFPQPKSLAGTFLTTRKPQNKSKAQTIQSLRRSIPSLSSLSHQTIPAGLVFSTSTLLGFVLASHPTFLAHCTHLPRDCLLFGRSVAHFPTPSTNLSVSYLLNSYFHPADRCLAKLVALSHRPLCSLVSTADNTTGLATEAVRSLSPPRGVLRQLHYSPFHALLRTTSGLLNQTRGQRPLDT